VVAPGKYRAAGKREHPRHDNARSERKNALAP
jgi:hypothetical protein